MDPRVKELSRVLTGYSCDLKKGEKVLIDYEGECCKPLVRQLIKDAYKLGARPYVNHRDSAVLREVLLGADEEQIEFLNDYQLYQMKGMDAYIAVRAGENTSELSDVPSDKLNMYYKLTRPTLDYRVNKTKWVVLRYPNPAMAQLAGTSQEAFEDFYFNVCTLDYQKMSKAMDPLVDLMNRTDKVRLVGPDTDLTFSIKDIPAINGVIQCMDNVVAPSNNTMAFLLTDIINNKKEGYYVAAQLVRAVGLLDTLMAWRDEVYEELYKKGTVKMSVQSNTDGNGAGHHAGQREGALESFRRRDPKNICRKRCDQKSSGDCRAVHERADGMRKRCLHHRRTESIRNHTKHCRKS